MSTPGAVSGAATGGRRVWVDHFAYTRTRLLGGAPVPWHDVPACVAYFGQCERLLGSDACLLPLDDFYAVRFAHDAPLREAMQAKRRSGQALRAMLGFEPARAAVASLAAALAAQSSAPLVLMLPVAGEWLRWAHRTAHGEDCEVDAEDVERGAMYVADFVRCFADTAVSGVLLVAGGANGLPQDAHRPLVNAAAHYRWSVGVLDTDGTAGNGGLDFRIAPPGSGDALGTLLDGPSEGAAPRGEWVYLRLAADATPERVLEAVAALRAE